jgi:hypothetical protein
MRTHVKFILLSSAYAPALLIAALLQSYLQVAVALGVAAAVLVATLRLILQRTRRNAVFGGATGDSYCLSGARTRESELTAFLLGYLLPFLQWNSSPAPLAFLALPCLVAVVLYLNWQIGVLHLNPTLMLLGWRVVEMTATDETNGQTVPATVLCRRDIPTPDESVPNPRWRVALVSRRDSSSLWIAEPIGGGTG